MSITIIFFVQKAQAERLLIQMFLILIKMPLSVMKHSGAKLLYKQYASYILLTESSLDCLNNVLS